MIYASEIFKVSYSGRLVINIKYIFIITEAKGENKIN